MNIAVQTPRWGLNVCPGYTGFVITKKSAVSAGIRWFEDQWSALARIPVPSHALVITGQDQTIEAFMDGVHYGTISSYLNNPDCTLLVRRPYRYSPDMGRRIVQEAERYVGDKYGTRLIAGMAIANSMTGKLMDKLSGGKFSEWVLRLFESKRAEICSELVSLGLQAQDELQGFGILGQKAYTIDPLELFRDKFIYEPPDYACELVNADRKGNDEPQHKTAAGTAGG